MHAGEVLDGRYELVRRLDAGGMGEVWEGIDRRIRRPVAVKVLQEEADPRLIPELVARLGREATAAGRLAHPHIVAVYDYNSIKEDGVPIVYIVMELVRGRSLAAELARGLPDVRQALVWAEQIALALEAAHGPEAGVVHRDLKPGNVMITHGGLVKLLDFGIARFMEENDTQHTKLTGGRMVGTPLYMAPEQCVAGPVDGRTDLYALGCLLFAMLTGRPPFQQERGLLQVMYRQVHETPVAPSSLRPEVFPELDRLVRDLLAKVPQERPPTAGVVVDRLRRLAAPPSPGEQGPADAGRSRRREETEGREEAEGRAASKGPSQARDEESVILDAEFVPEDDGPQDRGADYYDAFYQQIRTDLAARHQAARALEDPEESRAALASIAAHAVELLGADDPLTLDARFDLACATAKAGLVGDGAQLLAALIPALAAAHGPGDQRVLYARTLLPWFVAEAGGLRESSALYAAVVPDLRRALGDTHSMTLHTRFQQMVQLRRSGDAVAAVRGWLGLLPLLAADESAAATAADAREELAGCILDLHNADEAGRERAAQSLRVLVSELVPLLDTVSESAYAARTVLVRWIAEAGTARESLPGWKVLIADATAALGELHPLTLRARLGLAEHIMGAGDTFEAHTAFCELMPALAATLGAEAMDVLRCRFLIEATARRPQWAQLIPYLVRALGPEHQLTMDARFRQVLVAVEAGDRPADLAELRYVLGRRPQSLPADDALTLRGRFALADGTERSGRRAEARRLWQALLPDLVRVMGPLHHLTRTTQERLGLIEADRSSAATRKKGRTPAA